MANLRTLRQRIRSVQNTQKITKAMQMVAGAKLRRMQGELLSFRPYNDRLDAMVRRFLSAQQGINHPLLSLENKKGPAGLIVITSDTGLCGTYNERIIRLTERFLSENPSARIVTVGKKGSRFLARRKIPRLREILEWGGKYDKERSRQFVEWLQDLYLKGEVSSWHAAYTQFVSALKFKPVIQRVLPIECSAAQDAPDKLIVEPEAAELADQILKRYLQGGFTRIFLEAFTSEHSARMIAMKNATENASEMISTLTLVRNKVRQAAITKELIEVVGGSEALK